MTTTTEIGTPREALIDLHATPGFREYVREMWRRRLYVVRVPLSDLRARNLNNVLGMLWFVLNPLLQMAVYYLFFGLIVGTDRGVDNFLTFLACGIFAYTYLQRTMTSVSRTIVGNLGLIRAIRFPRAILPTATTIEQTIVQLPVLGVLMLVALVTGELPSWHWFLLAPLLFVQALFALAVGLVLARLTTKFRDIQNLLPFLFRLVFYMSGVLYSIDAFIANPTYRRLFYLNPFYDHIRLTRYAIFGGQFPTWAFVGAVSSTALLLPFGFMYFRRGEPYGGAGQA